MSKVTSGPVPDHQLLALSGLQGHRVQHRLSRVPVFHCAESSTVTSWGPFSFIYWCLLQSSQANNPTWDACKYQCLGLSDQDIIGYGQDVTVIQVTLTWSQSLEVLTAVKVRYFLLLLSSPADSFCSVQNGRKTAFKTIIITIMYYFLYIIFINHTPHPIDWHYYSQIVCEKVNLKNTFLGTHSKFHGYYCLLELGIKLMTVHLPGRHLCSWAKPLAIHFYCLSQGLRKSCFLHLSFYENPISSYTSSNIKFQIFIILYPARLQWITLSTLLSGEMVSPPQLPRLPLSHVSNPKLFSTT